MSYMQSSGVFLRNTAPRFLSTNYSLTPLKNATSGWKQVQNRLKFLKEIESTHAAELAVIKTQIEEEKASKPQTVCP
jgi:hypothetical protein